MRVRHLLYGIVLGAALFASSMSFAAAHNETGATNGSFHPAADATSSTFTQEVPLFAADWVAASATQQFAHGQEGHNSPAAPLPQTVKVIDDQPEAGEVVKLNYIVDTSSGRSGSVVISARVGPSSATASTAMAAGTPANFTAQAKMTPTESDAQFAVSSPPTAGSSVAFSTAEVLAIDQTVPRYAQGTFYSYAAGMQTEPITQFAFKQESIGT